MKKAWIIAMLLLVIVCCCMHKDVAYADIYEDIDNTIDEGLDHLDFDSLENQSNGLLTNIVAKMKSIMAGEFDNADSFLQFAKDIFLDNINTILPSVVSIFVMCLLCSIVTNTSSGFISAGTSNTIYFVTFAMVVSSIITVFYNIITSINGVLMSIGQLLDISVPILVTLMIANGANVTAKVYQPTVALMSTTVIKLISTVILPLSVFAFVFSIISNISDNIKVNKMSSFLSSVGNWILGIVFMVFFSFLSIQGVTAMSIDGVSIRAAKFATKNYIPILGGYLADGFDLIVASTTLIKNSFGVVILLVMLSAIIAPLVNILLLKFSLQFVSSVGEPVMDKRFVQLLSSVAKNLTFLAILLVAVLFMCLLVIMLAIMTANGF